MTAGTLYTTAAACRRCARSLPPDSAPNRLYCASCRDERRALTHMAEADRHLEASGSNRARLARASLNRAMGELESPR